jgi:hypothetical protein
MRQLSTTPSLGLNPRMSRSIERGSPRFRMRCRLLQRPPGECPDSDWAFRLGENRLEPQATTPCTLNNRVLQSGCVTPAFGQWVGNLAALPVVACLTTVYKANNMSIGYKTPTYGICGARFAFGLREREREREWNQPSGTTCGAKGSPAAFTREKEKETKRKGKMIDVRRNRSSPRKRKG